jgi:hypothetical protein
MIETEGWVYVLTNEAMPGLVKIGFSMKDPTIRAQDLYKDPKIGALAGVPMPFTVFYKALVVNAYKVERAVHKELECDRINIEREFFRCDPFDAIECIREHAEVKYEVCDEEYEEYEKVTLNYTTGSTYSGEYRISAYGLKYRHGQGTMIFPDGAKYIGEWQNDKKHGQGTHAVPGEWKYVGEWIDDRMHGQGTLTWPDGQKYVGAFKDDKKHGQGVITWLNGDEYVGEWIDDKVNGRLTNRSQ